MNKALKKSKMMKMREKREKKYYKNNNFKIIMKSKIKKEKGMK